MIRNTSYNPIFCWFDEVWPSRMTLLGQYYIEVPVDAGTLMGLEGELLYSVLSDAGQLLLSLWAIDEEPEI